jgi:hypothetical protein
VVLAKGGVWVQNGTAVLKSTTTTAVWLQEGEWQQNAQATVSARAAVAGTSAGSSSHQFHPSPYPSVPIG